MDYRYRPRRWEVRRADRGDGDAEIRDVVGFRPDFELAEKLAVHGRVSSERLTAAIVAPAAEADPSREQPLKKGKKKGKKRDKTAAKQHSGSKDRPVKAGKKGKKKKKGRKER